MLQDFLKQAFSSAIYSATQKNMEAEIAPCMQEQFGHYQCNSALKLAKILKENPRKTAQDICEHLPKESRQQIKKLEIAGPGFINITFSESFLAAYANSILDDEKLGCRIDQKKKIIVEFSSPNVAKELHVGHLRSTIIGECLARIFEFLGNDVLRLNHIGNWGTQFGMLIAFLKEFHPDVLSGSEKTDLSSLMQWYKNSKKKFDEDLAFRKRAHQEVVNLQAKEKVAYHAWKIICDISRQAFEEIYNLLDVSLMERGESFYNPMLQEVVDDLMQRKIAIISEGAKCVFLEGFYNKEKKPLPLIIQKSDGGFNYATTDIAAFKQRCQDEKAKRIIVVTDLGQSLHFQMVSQAVIKAGYLDPKKTQFDHVTFGVVLGSDGKKFKTREGKTEKLIDLLSEAISHAKKVLKERMTDIDEKQLEQYAKILGIDAVKYADLSSHRQKDYVFSYGRMLKLEGNTAAFLLYSYVRILSIQKKVGLNIEELKKTAAIALEHESEVSLVLHLGRFSEVIKTVSEELLPNRLCDYLYTLAEKFNAFFRDCRVQGSEQEKSRLLICELSRLVLLRGFSLLGLKTLPRM